MNARRPLRLTDRFWTLAGAFVVLVAGVVVPTIDRLWTVR